MDFRRTTFLLLTSSVLLVRSSAQTEPTRRSRKLRRLRPDSQLYRRLHPLLGRRIRPS